MIEQLAFTSDGRIRGKVDAAIQRLKCFEPEDGYYVAFSGGKDSQCVYHLCQMAGVKFDAHYAVTSVDPPELVQFIKEHYPDAWEGRMHQYKDGKPVTMWSLIQEHNVPPSRKFRYCCANLKEPGGENRVTVTGVRWAESPARAATHDVVAFQGKKKSTIQAAETLGVNYRLNIHGDLVMNDDNDEARRMVEQCYRTRKTMINPIVDWTDEDVWQFLKSNGIPYCRLYDEGFERLGCIGCPLAGRKNMTRDFQRWPKYRDMYIRAFDRMIKARDAEMIWIRRVGGSNTFEYVPNDQILRKGEAMFDLWHWICSPKSDAVPNNIQIPITADGKMSKAAIESLEKYNMQIAGIPSGLVRD